MAESNQRRRYRIYTAGAQPDVAAGAVIMIHGRGASPADILSLASEFDRDDLLYLAPEAPGGAWYPFRFMEPIARNEPGITLGMQAIDDALGVLAEHDIGADRTVLLGFSQGACLAVEYAARHARRYGGIVGLSGGLIGPEVTPRDYPGSLDGTPVFLGCSDVDFHIPVGRVHETAQVLERLGGQVTEQIYPGMDHTVNANEIEHVNCMLELLGTSSRQS